MARFELLELDDEQQSDFKADGRLRAFFTLKKAFKERARDGVTVGSLAEAIGRDKGQISKVLSGKSGITLDTFILLMCALGFRLSFVAERVEHMRPHNWTAEPYAAPRLTGNMGLTTLAMRTNSSTTSNSSTRVLVGSNG